MKVKKSIISLIGILLLNFFVIYQVKAELGDQFACAAENAWYECGCDFERYFCPTNFPNAEIGYPPDKIACDDWSACLKDEGRGDDNRYEVWCNSEHSKICETHGWEEPEK